MRFIELFGGIGGFRLGLEQADKKFRAVRYNDIDKYAVSVYNRRFKTSYEARDIRTVQASEIPEHDLLTAGFPCQSFSIAGKRGGFEDTRGTLFFEIARILESHRPRYLLLENVKGLLNHEKGKTFTIILQTLQELGYDVEWGVLNSRYFGVPQNRERVFIKGSLRGSGGRKIFPIRVDAGEVQEVSEVARCLTPGHRGDGNHSDMNCITPDGKSIKRGDLKIYDRKGFDSRTKGFRENEISPTLSTKMGTGGNNVPMVVAQRGRNPENPSDRTPGNHVEQTFEPNKEGISNTISTVQKDNYVATIHQLVGDRDNPSLSSKNYANTIPANPMSDRQQFLGDKKLRRLTPTECARLQGFPDDWTREGLVNDKIVKISDTQQYKMYGNAVTVNVIKAIGERL